MDKNTYKRLIKNAQSMNELQLEKVVGYTYRAFVLNPAIGKNIEIGKITINNGPVIQKSLQLYNEHKGGNDPGIDSIEGVKYHIENGDLIMDESKPEEMGRFLYNYKEAKRIKSLQGYTQYIQEADTDNAEMYFSRNNESYKMTYAERVISFRKQSDIYEFMNPNHPINIEDFTPEVIAEQNERYKRGEIESYPTLYKNYSGYGNTIIWEKKDGKRHRENDLPAYVDEAGFKAWYLNGDLNRNGDKPARVWVNGHRSWERNSQTHRGGGKPAEIITGEEGNAVLRYFIDGRFQREVELNVPPSQVDDDGNII